MKFVKDAHYALNGGGVHGPRTYMRPIELHIPLDIPSKVVLQIHELSFELHFLVLTISVSFQNDTT